MQPATLVEAERKGAELAQKLAQDVALSRNGKLEALADSTNHSNRNSNGHKEIGATCFTLSVALLSGNRSTAVTQHSSRKEALHTEAKLGWDSTRVCMFGQLLYHFVQLVLMWPCTHI